MGESTILKVTINQEEIIFLETFMKLEKKAGEHTVVFFTGILEPGKDGQEYCIVPEAEIEIFDKGMEEILFRGMIKTVEIGIETADADPLKRVELELVSGTYRLDRKKRDRAFQNTAMNFETVALLPLYNFAICICVRCAGVFLSSSRSMEHLRIIVLHVFLLFMVLWRGFFHPPIKRYGKFVFYP